MPDQEDRSLSRQLAEASLAGLFEANTHSFVLRIWREEPTCPTDKPLWRGHITHVPSGQRRYFQELDDINTFITTYLQINLETNLEQSDGQTAVGGASFTVVGWSATSL